MTSTSLIKLPTAGLLVIKNNKLLLAFSRNKKAWYLPGGKVDSGETSRQALIREIKEELDVTLQAGLLKFYCHITAPAYGEKNDMIMEQDCYLYELDGDIIASSEIEAVAYFDFETYQKEPVQVAGVLLVFENLLRERLLV